MRQVRKVVMPNLSLDVGRLEGEFQKLLAGGPAIRAKPSLEEGERRDMTILFLDIKGYTALSERLDPEQVKFLLTNALKIFTQQVENFGGVVEKYMGDALMALYGRNAAHEDESIWASHTALKIFERLAEINEIVKSQNVKLEARIGINRGLVVTGGQESVESVTGDAINTAQRLESNAEPGTIYVSESVLRHLRGTFEVEELPPLVVKNKAEPLKAYKIIKPKETATVAGLEETPFIGREAEKKLLGEAWERARTKGVTVVQVLGEAGMGKSRLAGEWTGTLKSSSHPPALILVGKSQSMGAPPYQILTSSVRDWLQGARLDPMAFVDAIPLDESRKAIREREAYLRQWLGLPLSPLDAEKIRAAGPETVQKETFAVIKHVVMGLLQTAKITPEAPCLWYLDDLHSILSSSQEALEFLIRALPENCPVLFLLVSRPGLAIKTGTIPVQSMTLGPLTRDESLTLLRHHIGSDTRFDPAFKTLLTYASGNPLFLEELARAVKGSEWLLGQGELELPSTISTLIRSAIDRLPKDERLVLQVVSVASPHADREVVSRMLTEIGQPTPVAWVLEQLIKIGYLSHGGNEHYVFSQELVQNSIYQGLLNSNKKLLHRLAATIVEGKVGSNDETFFPYLAEQFSRAEEWDKAVFYLLRWAEVAKRQFLNEEAAQGLKRALNILKAQGASAQRLLPLLRDLSLLADLAGRYAEQQHAIEEALALTSDPSERAPFEADLGYALWMQGRYDEGCKLLDPLLAERFGQLPEAIKVRALVHRWLIARSQKSPTDDYLRRALELSQSIHERLLASRLHLEMCNEYKLNNRLKEAETHLTASTRFIDPNNTFQSHLHQLFLCSLLWDKGDDFRGLQRRAEQTANYFNETGWIQGEITSNLLDALALWRLGQYNEALESALHGRQLALQIDLKNLAYHCQTVTTVVQLCMGQNEGYEKTRKDFLEAIRKEPAETTSQLERGLLVSEILSLDPKPPLEWLERLTVLEANRGASVDDDEYELAMAWLLVHEDRWADALARCEKIREGIERNEKTYKQALLYYVTGLGRRALGETKEGENFLHMAEAMFAALETPRELKRVQDDLPKPEGET